MILYLGHLERRELSIHLLIDLFEIYSSNSAKCKLSIKTKYKQKRVSDLFDFNK